MGSQLQKWILWESLFLLGAGRSSGLQLRGGLDGLRPELSLRGLATGTQWWFNPMLQRLSVGRVDLEPVKFSQTRSANSFCPWTLTGVWVSVVSKNSEVFVSHKVWIGKCMFHTPELELGPAFGCLLWDGTLCNPHVF